MVNIDDYKSVAAFREAVENGSCTKDDLLDLGYDGRISSWLKDRGEHEREENLRVRYDKNSGDDTQYVTLLKSLSFTEEEIERLGNGTFTPKPSPEPKDTMDLLSQRIEDLRRLLVGSISLFPTGGVPEGWLPCEGQLLSKESFKKLYLRLGDTSSGKEHFALPDLSSPFLGKGIMYCIFTGEEKITPEQQITLEQQQLSYTVNGVSFTMIRVKGGTFRMGSNASSDSQPIHDVSLSTYCIGQYPVTQALWKAVMDGKNPSSFKGDLLPVESVSWIDCQDFIQKLNNITGVAFRLPTEAEWEFAARGGVRSKGFLYSGSDDPDKVAWFGENSDGQTHPVGQKSSNELGLYDMSGNVWEWCQDWYDGNYYSRSVGNNPTGPISGSDRVGRGGGWGYPTGFCAVSYRCYDSPGYTYYDLGFRLAFACSSK